MNANASDANKSGQASSKNTKENSQRLPGLWYSDVRLPKIARHTSVCDQLLRQLESQRTTTKGLSQAHRAAEHQAVEWLIEALYQSTQCIPAVPLIFPMTRGYYTASSPNRIPMAYRAKNRILLCCKEFGWVVIHTGSRTSQSLTRIFPAGFLLQYFQSLGIEWHGFAPSALDAQIQMTVNPKTRKRRPIEDHEFIEVGQWRLNLALINQHLNRQCIYLDLPDNQLNAVGQGLLKDKEVSNSLAFGQVILRRVFTNERFDHGGRFYGAWWQHIKSELRPWIRINGEPTVEVDYRAMCLRCLHAKEGLVPPDDPYDVGYHYRDENDPRRKIIKDFINALLNDHTKRIRLSAEKLTILGETSTRAVKDRILRYHPFLKDWLHSGVGIELQYLDSQIAERVMLQLLKQGITCLPIHDSFIVQRSAYQPLIDAMNEAYRFFTHSNASMKADPGIADQGMWVIPDPIPPNDEAIANAYLRHMNEDYSIAMNYFISWVMETRSAQDIDQDLQTAMDDLTRTNPATLRRILGSHPPDPSKPS